MKKAMFISVITSIFMIFCLSIAYGIDLGFISTDFRIAYSFINPGCPYNINDRSLGNDTRYNQTLDQSGFFELEMGDLLLFNSEYIAASLDSSRNENYIRRTMYGVRSINVSYNCLKLFGINVAKNDFTLLDSLKLDIFFASTNWEMIDPAGNTMIIEGNSQRMRGSYNILNRPVKDFLSSFSALKEMDLIYEVYYETPINAVGTSNNIHLYSDEEIHSSGYKTSLFYNNWLGFFSGYRADTFVEKAISGNKHTLTFDGLYGGVCLIVNF